MKKLNIIKITVDIIMMIIFALLFRGMGIGGGNHEVLGIAIAIFMAVHMALNWSSIKGVGKNIFKRNLQTKSRIEFIVNMLMVISIGAAVITGLFISKRLFPFLRVGNTMILTKVHISSSFLSLAFIGAHIGLRWNVISNAIKKALKITEVRKEYGYVGKVLVGALLIFGIYSFYSENYFSKVLMLQDGKSPMRLEQNIQGFRGPQNPNNGGKQRTENTPNPKNGREGSVQRPQGGKEQGKPFEKSFNKGRSEGNHMGVKNGQEFKGRGTGILDILGITSAFTIITICLEKLFTRRKKVKKEEA